jgi:predicted RNA binding protein YcfA (HicA-like mRNA interferase family)
MSFLPIISGKECVTALEKVGYYVKRQSGSHIILRKDEPFCQVTIPNHRTLDRGTLFKIIRSTELSVNEFKELCK